MNIPTQNPEFYLSLAETEADLRAAQRLRYDVFVEELGGDGDMVDHTARIEADRFDPYSDHLLLRQGSGEVIGVYRVMRDDQAARAGQFYCDAEYDLTPLTTSGRRVMELGRSCLHSDWRGGAAMYHLWSGLAAYVRRHRIDLMFGVASLHGTDIDALAAPLSLLHHRHLAPAGLRPRSRVHQRMDLLPENGFDRRAAMIGMPALLKAYLRLGGIVGDGAFVDHAFNTTDVCMILDTAAMNDRQARIYQNGAGSGT